MSIKLEHLVCTKEQAKRLKELGVTQKSLYYWFTHDYKWDGKNVYDINEEGFDLTPASEISYVESKVEKNICFSAFTVGELGMMLPKDFLCWKIDNETWSWGYIVSKDSDCYLQPKGECSTEASARCEMLIYFLKNNEASINDVNSALCKR